MTPINPKRVIAIILAVTLSAFGQAVFPIQNGKLTGPFNGNSQDINNPAHLSLGAGTGAARLHILPGSNPTAQADGIAIGSDIHLYRSGSGTLTLTGNIVVTGTISGNGNVITLGGTNIWTGTNSYSGSSSFTGPVSFASGGFVFSGSGAGDLRTALSLVPGTNVQAYSANLLTIAGLSPANGAVIIGNGTAWTEKTGGTLLTAIGLGTGDSPSFTGLSLSGAITAAAGTVTGLSVPGATSSGAAMLIGGAGVYSDSGVLTVPGGFKTLGAVQLSNDTGLAIYALGVVYFKANQDTNLYRSSAGVLKTDGDFIATNLKPANPVSATYGGLGIDTHTITAGAYPYTSGTGVWTTGTITSFGRSFLASADGAAARSVLGYGSVALLSSVTPAYGGLGLDTSSTSANSFPYTSATGTWSVATVTPFARTLLDDADAATVRSTLGLGSLAVLSTATPATGGLGINTSAVVANSFPYTNGTGTWTTGTVTSFGRSLMDDTDAAAGRTTLGLGAVSTVSIITPALGGLGIDTSSVAANAYPYTSATGVWSTATITTFGRSLVAAADAAAVKTLLSLSISDYVATVTAGSGITVTGGTGAGSTPTVSLSGSLPISTLVANAATAYTWAGDVTAGTMVLFINCTNAGASLALPSSPSVGQYLVIKNVGDSNCTITGGFIPINDSGVFTTVLAGSATSSARETIVLIYDNISEIWQVIDRGTSAP